MTVSLIADERAARIAEINRQMWIPFVEGVNTDKPELYVGVHSPEFYWVAPGPNGRVMDLREYDEDSRKVMKDRQAEKAKTTIEIRFLERNVRESFAAEKCIMKYVLERPGKPAETGYGIAHFFSRREKGVWKMWLQHGSREKATAEMFEAAEKVE